VIIRLRIDVGGPCGEALSGSPPRSQDAGEAGDGQRREHSDKHLEDVSP